MIQGVATTQPAPVGVGWGKYPVAWLVSYYGDDCGLWRTVLNKCLESQLCEQVVDLLPEIGYSIEKHRCFEPH